MQIRDVEGMTSGLDALMSALVPKASGAGYPLAPHPLDPALLAVFSLRSKHGRD